MTYIFNCGNVYCKIMKGRKGANTMKVPFRLFLVASCEKRGIIMMNEMVKAPAVKRSEGFMDYFFSSFGLAELGIGAVLGLAICLAASTSAAVFVGPMLILSILVTLLMFR